MDIFTVLSYINKISFLAFFITLLFLGYQFYMLKKESSLDKKDIANLPSFNEDESPQILNYTKLNLPNISQDQNQKKTVSIKKNNQVILFSILIVFFLLFLIVVFFNFNKKEQTPISQKSAVSLVISPTLTIEPTIKPTITVENQISPTLELSPTFLPSPTEVLLSFVSPTETPSFTLSVSKIENLPLTGFFDNIFLFFGLSFLFIFLAFIF